MPFKQSVRTRIYLYKLLTVLQAGLRFMPNHPRTTRIHVCTRSRPHRMHHSSYVHPPLRICLALTATLLSFDWCMPDCAARLDDTSPFLFPILLLRSFLVAFYFIFFFFFPPSAGTGNSIHI